MGIGIVQTTAGKIRGVELDGKYSGITMFKGIPYAAPPVGRLRWRPPESPEPWEGVRLCDTYAKMAPQIFPPDEVFVPYKLDFYYEGYPECSEDCLYLNVSTGASSGEERRPVYIWFHGGGLSTGFSYEVEFNPEELTRKGIVVVTVAQRLNVFGYLALPQLSREQGGASGNYGLMDQLKALEWVRENIRAFGGDPDNITIGGQSGGTTKTCVMAGLPCVKGKIRRVINESGLKWKLKLKTLEEVENASMEYLKKLGIDPDISPTELRSMDVWALCDGSGDMPAEILCDGILVPDVSVSKMFEENLDTVDFLCGTNYGEGYPIRNEGDEITNPEEFYANYRKFLGDLYDTHHFEALYPVTKENCWPTAMRLAGIGIAKNDRRGMGRNVMLNRVFGMKRAAGHPGSRVYAYLFSHVLPGRPEDEGTPRATEKLLAYHSSELWYTFASIRENVPPVRPWRDVDYQVADMVSSYWANFIATGDVNGEGLPYWPAASENYGWMDILPEPVAHEGLDSEEDQLLRAYIQRVYGE